MVCHPTSSVIKKTKNWSWKLEACIISLIKTQDLVKLSPKILKNIQLNHNLLYSCNYAKLDDLDLDNYSFLQK